MADNDFHSEAIGAVYAQALVNTARQQNALDEVTQDVRGLTQVLAANPRFAEFAEAATISNEEKMAAIEKIFAGRVHPLVVETLRSLARRDRLMFLRGFIAAFETILLRLSNHVDVELVSAQELSPQALARVQDAVARALGKTPDFATRVDPTLLGGLKLRVGDTMIDASVETQLKRMQQQLQQKGTTALQQKLESIVT